jgi:hypothetical protein
MGLGASVPASVFTWLPTVWPLFQSPSPFKDTSPVLDSEPSGTYVNLTASVYLLVLNKSVF